ncbi:MAG TPA: DUF1905 domain-containing protein [Steroidobacteraceae bacterium]|nr:DUF1905 domain-containing protein [Steroidobacteraceae bacterium]
MKPFTATESTYEFRARLWRWSGGKASWYFLTLPAVLAREIRLVDAGPRRVGFGSLRVRATIGESTWPTSIFPSSQHRSYLLPVKAAVRKAGKLAAGRTVSVRIVVHRA